jgi:hypothetical protein
MTPETASFVISGLLILVVVQLVGIFLAIDRVVVSNAQCFDIIDRKLARMFEEWERRQ